MRRSGRAKRMARTLGGPILYCRAVYECGSCRGSYAPADAELGLWRGEKLTRGVVRKVAYVAAHQSYGQGSRALAELAGLSVSPAEFARLSEQEGQRLADLQAADDQAYLEPVGPDRPVALPEIRAKRLVLQADATCVLTVPDEEHKSVYCAVAFEAEARGKDERGRPFIAEKRYTASAENLESFGYKLIALAYRMGLRRAEQICFLADGARCLWRWARDNLPKNTVLIQDFWHVCEHLAQLARDLDAPSAEDTFRRWKQLLRNSQVDQIIGELKDERKRRRGSARDRIDEEIHYLESGRERMDYARYERQGWPIGSGAVEATCKHLVKERFCVTGAHWRRKNIGKLLAMRQAIFNEEWDGCWKHLSQAA